MDLDNPVIAKLFDRAYGEKLANETQRIAAEAQKKLQEELALAAQRVAEAERREAEAERRETEAMRQETETTKQWQELMFKVLEHRFPSVPMALILLLHAVKPAQRSRVSDIILDSPDVDSCLQALRELQAGA